MVLIVDPNINSKKEEIISINIIQDVITIKIVNENPETTKVDLL